jgi:hypothetical protein
MYDAFVTIKIALGIAYVNIMKTEDAIRIIEINELVTGLVSSRRDFVPLSSMHTDRLVNVTPGSGPIYEGTQRVRTIRCLLSALL